MTNDKQRERLVELLNEAEYKRLEYEMANKFYPFDDYKSRSEFVADHLLANGVIVLPNLRHKQTAYHIYDNRIVPLEVSSYAVRPEFDNLLQIHLYRNGFNGCCTIDDFGKTVFLTKEEAEQALNNIQNGNSCEEGAE